FPIDTPPLLDRAEDLPLLVNDLVERLGHEGRGSIRLTPTCIDSLARYTWPGNVRELANLIERMSILYPNGVVDAHDLPDKYRADELLVPARAAIPSVATNPLRAQLPRGGLDLKEHMTQIETDLITQALNEESWIVAHAAKRLQMGRTTLVEKMRKLGLNRQEEVSDL
ncbi:MAG: helix-turn-helix domain-containing protein, partial [Gammaproteobacteria bacterium]